jgi:FlaG/FlaF family flagellin (archaellin)
VKFQRRRAVSELLATMMMIGVTLSVGGYITMAAINQFNLAENAASLAALVQQQSAGKLVSLVYSTVTPSGTCPAYGGHSEGTLTLELYNYGTTTFAPSEAFDNGTLYAGTGSIAAGSMGAFAFASPPCVHASGQTILLVDSYGNEIQFGT